MNSLFLAWQSQASRAWYPIGLLQANPQRTAFEFEYTGGALEAKADGFHPIASFPNIDTIYRSDSLFPVFQNRLINFRRGSDTSYLESFGLDPAGSLDPLETLALTGGTRATDNFEVFPRLQKDLTNSFECKFFLHGLSHVPEASLTKIAHLQTGDSLQLMFELNNPTGEDALLVSTTDYHVLGWAPRYLLEDFSRAAACHKVLSAKVLRVNGANTPLSRRLIVEIKGKLPEEIIPMSGQKFQPISRLHLIEG